jgi:D-arabinose 1-dehydrogenase-like Zn-dependent alcohol dehydrogenase
MKRHRNGSSMKVLLAGATGVIGSRLVPLLVSDGYAVIGMTRSPEKVEHLREQGANAIVCDVYDLEELGKALRGSEPDLVMHQLTDLPDDRARIPGFADASQRMYIEGTDNLLNAATAAGCERIVAQRCRLEVAGQGGCRRGSARALCHERGGNRDPIRAVLRTRDLFRIRPAA